MKNKKYILFIDSGIGGISILDHFLTKKNDLNIIYYADTANFPYGKKDEKIIGKILFSIYKKLIKKYDIALIVIVCNTASVSALEYLRKKIKIPIIGTVPAIKPASLITKNNNIGIIATETTVKGNYLNNLVNQFAANKNVFIKSSSKLVDIVEKFENESIIKKTIEKELKYFKEKNIDVLVLGCTHYSFLDNYIKKYFNSKVTIIDSRDGVTKRILDLLPGDIECKKSEKLLFISDGTNKIEGKYKKMNKKLKIFDLVYVEDLSCQKV